MSLRTQRWAHRAGSRVGRDPQSRRAVWDFVLENQAGRATLLTTHFMDEADVLCSSVVVVSKGMLAAVGSPSELKARYAAGYHLVAAIDSGGGGGSADALLQFTQKHVPAATLDDGSAEQASITLPAEAQPAFPSLFDALDGASAELGVTSYGVSLPSMQEAFLKILDAQRAAGGYAEAASDAQPTSQFEYTSASVCTQMGVILGKIWMEVVAEGITSAVLLLLIVTLVVFSFVLGVIIRSGGDSIDPDVPTAVVLSPAPFDAVHGSGYPLPYLPATGAVADALADGSTLQTQYGYAAAPSNAAVDPAAFDGPHRALSESIATDAGAFAAFALASASPAPYAATTLLYNASLPHALPAYFALFDAALMQTAAPGLSLTASVGALPSVDDNDSAAEAAELSMQIAPLVTIFTMLLLVLLTSSRLAAERFASTKQLLLLSGLDVRIFWAGYLVWDLALLSVLLVGIGAIAAGASGVVSAAALPALVLCELAALPGIVVMSYLITLPFKNSDEAAGFIVMFFMLFGLVPTILLSFIPSPAAKLACSIILLLAPPNQVITGLNAILTLQLYSARVETAGGDAYTTADYFKLTYESYSYNMATGELS